jgi:hypothetical protein
MKDAHEVTPSEDEITLSEVLAPAQRYTRFETSHFDSVTEHGLLVFVLHVPFCSVIDLSEATLWFCTFE